MQYCLWTAWFTCSPVQSGGIEPMMDLVTTDGMTMNDQLDSLRQQIRMLRSAERVELLQELMGEAACRHVGVYPIPPGFKLSVVIPVFNEERWIRELIRRVKAVDIAKGIVIVDAYSN